MIDGCTRFGALRRIIFPLVIPGMVIVLVFSFLVGWNDVLFASVLTDPKTQTAAVQLNVFAASTEGGALPLYGQLMAASLITSAPVGDPVHALPTTTRRRSHRRRRQGLSQA